MAVVGLVFAIGWAHETLYQRGIGEVAMGWLGRDLTVETSWSVDETASVLVLGGEPSDLESALRTVRVRLSAGPDALVPHKIVAGGDLDGELLRRRFGWASYGLGAATRYGYRTVDADAVRDWLGRIGSTTCLQFTAEVDPDPLSLPQVPPIPEPARTQLVTSGSMPVDHGLGLSWLAERNPTAALATEIMIAAVAGVVPAPTPAMPGVTGRYRSIGADTRHVGLVASDSTVSPALTPGVLDQLRRLSTDGPQELEIVKAMDRQARSQDISNLDHAIRATIGQLWLRAGYLLPVEHELSAEPDVLELEIRRQCATLLLLAPEVPADSFLPAAAGTDIVEPAVGTTYRPRRAMREVGMGPESIVVDERRLTHRSGRDVTTSTDTAAVVERRPDGERVIVDRSGVTLVVDPLLWSRGRQLVGWVDARFPQQVVLEERLAASPYVARAALRARPGVVIAVMALTGIVGLIMLGSAAVTADENRWFKAVFGAAFLALQIVWWRALGDVRRLRTRAGLR